jgi:Holliday junction resolvase-like predicted endonuclease
MKDFALWQIDMNDSASPSAPRRLQESFLELEKHLESWIEADPDMLERGLCILGRQVHTVAGPIDLLGRDPQGRWAIIEVKRAQATRLALAQAIDYASAIAELSNDDLMQAVAAHPAKQTCQPTPAMKQEDSPEERQLRIILVGIGADPALPRVVDFLSSKFQLPITAVAFSLFQVDGGGPILVRELNETEGAPLPSGSIMPTLDEHISRASVHGLGESFRTLITTATALGLRSKSFKNSVMIAPPTNGNRTLFTIWDTPEESGKLTLWIGPEAFEQLLGIPQDLVVSHLGPGDWRRLSEQELLDFARGLEALLSETLGREGDSNADSNPHELTRTTAADGG